MLGFDTLAALPIADDALADLTATGVIQAHASGANALFSQTRGEQSLTIPGGQTPLSTSVGGDQPLQGH